MRQAVMGGGDFDAELQQPPQATHAAHGFARRSSRPSPYSHRRSATVAEKQTRSFDDVDITSPIQAPPSALTSTAANTAYDPHSDAPSLLEDYPQSSNHQRTLTGTFFQTLDRASSTIQQHTSRPSSPIKSLASYISSRGQAESTASQPKTRALQGWFNGASAPVQLGVSQRRDEESDLESESGSEPGSEFYSESEEEAAAEEEEEEEDGGRGNNMIASIFTRGPSSPIRNLSPTRSVGTPTPTKPPQSGGKFSWLLTPKTATPAPAQSPTYHNPGDELLNLNVTKALFPHGPADPLAPSSFNDLVANAEALVARYQTSYRQLSTTYLDTQMEQSAQEEELYAAETRARLLKMQLENMAARATEQDEQMRKLLEDLALGRRARQEAEAARKRSSTLVQTPPQCKHAACQETAIRRMSTTTSTYHPGKFLAEGAHPTGSANPPDLLILNQPIAHFDAFARLWAHTSFRVCADGGANRLFDMFTGPLEHQRENYLPDLIHGDLDSLRDDVRAYYSSLGAEVSQDHDQYTTDLGKNIQKILSRKTSPSRKDVLVLGTLAGRVDQGIGLLHEMMREETKHPDLRLWLFSECSVSFLLQSQRNVITGLQSSGLFTENTGLLPIWGPSNITTNGLEWDVEEWESCMGGQVSTSNHVRADEVLVKTTGPVLFTVECRVEGVKG
jgi:thiamine pyrophosphokinase